MNYSKQILSFICIGILLTLAGCAKKNSYKPNKLLSLKESAHVDYQETKEQVTIRAKAFTKLDCDYVFGDRSNRLMSRKNNLQPIQLCIENNGVEVLLLFDKNIGLPMVPAKKVLNIFTDPRYTAAAICGGIGLLGLLFCAAPLLLPAALGELVFLVLPGNGIAALFIWALFGITSASIVFVGTPCIFIADNALFGSCPEEIKNCIHQTDKGKAIVINPGKTIDMLIFVHRDKFEPAFKCTLINDNNNKEIPFMINLSPAH